MVSVLIRVYVHEKLLHGRKLLCKAESLPFILEVSDASWLSPVTADQRAWRTGRAVVVLANAAPLL